jgi:glycosyltransferase involved in cell wall biosynthesis
MAVLQVVPALGSGGVEQNTVDMAIYLKKHDFIPYVASRGGPKVVPLRQNKITHFNLPLHRKDPFSLWRNSRRLRKIIKAYHIDIVHARSRAPAWAAWLACRDTTLNCRFITTFHGTYGAGNWLKRAYNRVMLKGSLVIANSLFTKQHIIKTYGFPAARIVAIPRGIDPTPFNPRPIRRRAPDTALPAGPLLTLVGRLTRWKGQAVFIEALAEIIDLNWHALIVGGPTRGNPYYDELLALVQKYNLGQRITFLGDRADVPQLLAQSTLAFSCSTEPEAFGRAAVEAQMAGRPVIATRLGGSLETVQNGQTGWLVAPGQPHILARTIRRALTDKARLNSMGSKARRWALRHFTTTRCCEAEAAVYVKLLSNKKVL